MRPGSLPMNIRPGRRWQRDRRRFHADSLNLRRADVAVRHLGVYPPNALVAGHAHAVVAVQNEVGVAQPVKRDRRQLFASMVGSVNSLPLRPQACPYWQESGIEVRKAAHAADYLLDRHYPLPEADLVVCAERLPGLPER